MQFIGLALAKLVFQVQALFMPGTRRHLLRQANLVFDQASTIREHFPSGMKHVQLPNVANHP
ncbi:hypothetical protein N826_07525 [Skermanella aerolata KACC 11604]|nr:hypothetical protein N826_07525 [Skermanella aerolata KACC 11604]